MMTTRYSKYAILLFTTSLLLVFSNLLNEYETKPKLKVSKQDSAINFNSKIALFFSLGQRRLISDLLWIETLIESDLEHYTEKDLNSWMYLRFENMTNYDPQFYQAYYFGGKYLNIVKDDLLGSHEIFKKSEKHFKMDYEINFNAGFLYAFELNWPKEAIERYTRILKNKKTPPYIKSILIKLKYQKGIPLQEVFSLLSEMHSAETDIYLKERLEIDLFSIRTELDLNCLNSKKHLNKCNRTDYYGKAYPQKIDGSYFETKDFTPFQLHTR